MGNRNNLTLAGRATSRLLSPRQRSAAARAVTPRRSPDPLPLRGLTDQVVWRPVAELKPFGNNPRKHPEAQIARLMQNIERVWTNPMLIDETGTILAGHGR